MISLGFYNPFWQSRFIEYHFWMFIMWYLITLWIPRFKRRLLLPYILDYGFCKFQVFNYGLKDLNLIGFIFFSSYIVALINNTWDDWLVSCIFCVVVLLYNLQFSISHIHRLLMQKTTAHGKVGVTTAVYFTTILEYLTAEVLLHFAHSSLQSKKVWPLEITGDKWH